MLSYRLTGRLGVLAASMAAAALVATITPNLQASAQPAPQRHIVAFHQPLSDATVMNLVTQSGVHVEALHASILGMTGSHRTYSREVPANFVSGARESTLASFRSGLDSNVFRLRRFADQHSEAEVGSSAPLQTELRSLLNIRAKLQSAIAATSGGEALIYAVEVTNATPQQLAALSRTSAVRRVVEVGDASGRLNVKPATLDIQWLDPGVAALPSSEVYAALTRTIREAGTK